MRVKVLVVCLVCLCGITALVSYHAGERKNGEVVESYLRARVSVVDSLTSGLDVVKIELDKMIADVTLIAEKATSMGDKILDSGFEASAELRFDRHAGATKTLIANAQIEIAKATLLVFDSQVSIIVSRADVEHHVKAVHEIGKTARQQAEIARQELKRGNAAAFRESLNLLVASTVAAVIRAKKAQDSSEAVISDIDAIRRAAEFISSPKRYEIRLK